MTLLRRCLPATLLAMCTAGWGQAAPRPEAPLIVGRAELMNAVKSDGLKVGDHFFLQTVGVWQQADCVVADRTLLRGEITALTLAMTGGQRVLIGMRFAPIACSKVKGALLQPQLIALVAQSAEEHDSLRRLAINNVEVQGIQNVFTPGGGGARPDNVSTSFSGMFSSAGMASVVNKMGQAAPSAEKAVKTGEVRGMRGLEMTLPGREAVTTLTSSHKIALNRFTEFVLAFSPDVPQLSPRSVEASAAAEGRKPASEPRSAKAMADAKGPDTKGPDTEEPDTEELREVCASAGCKQLTATPASASGKAAWSLSLASLGYQGRPLQEIVGLDNSASVHFLGDDQLLLTFTLHFLVKRSRQEGEWESNPRQVRGVLVSRGDGRVLRVLDWTVPDSLGPFVWSPGDGRVLAHVGPDLVAFGPDLVIQRRVHLPGPLLFLSAASGGDPLLVATLHEKHTHEEHEELARTLGPGLPLDEDYDLTGLNAALQPLGTRSISSEPTRPALLKDSIITAKPGHATNWTLEENTWEGQTKTLLHLRSSCDVDVKSLPGALLLVRGCPLTDSSTSWYRVLNASGATLLKGTSTYGEYVQEAETDRGGHVFAVAMSHFDRPVSRTTKLHSGDFKDLTVTVYETGSGKQAFVARLQNGSPQDDTFALSLSGSDLAVLTSDSLQNFPLGASIGSN